ncbi:MAG: mechanosensitive ion channel family protein [Alteromonadaceae bacterium TMED7]|uniref:Small-conductance mechanosensitive channel n=1 Tax=Alteromonas alba TaxID=2079529 RepID=A0A2S9V839_9ALTE|nr:mechanosensitive ion channel family protein [Alteromonas alba]PRO72637.1 mechanosensitive ion channel protein [Alteromonas alba]RPH14969.1 MAG: mechanosensitive ion channel family protein [Alteromonadaceae bacterium TMED7]|tara:strand:- start:17808 stop:18782 length:975 start_codon:yes stop_codon:yes gene_type:complete
MKALQLDTFWQLINEKLERWVEASIKHLPNIAVAIFIAMAFGLLAKIVGNLAHRVLSRTFDSTQIVGLLTSIIKVAIATAGIFIALDFIGLRGTVTSLLAGAGIVGLAIGFAFQDITENLIAGIAMGVRKPFQIGDVIEAEGVFGNVEAINLRNTHVMTFFGQREIIPNKILFRNILTNYSVNGHRRVEVPVGISYADDPQQAAEVLTEAVNEFDFVIRKEETGVWAESFGDSSINLLVWFWIEYPGEPGFLAARHQVIVAIQRALSDANILIPFPIRTLDFGAKGGEKLNAMLNDSVLPQNQTDDGASQPSASEDDNSPGDDS